VTAIPPAAPTGQTTQPVVVQLDTGGVIVTVGSGHGSAPPLASGASLVNSYDFSVGVGWGFCIYLTPH
jgi:hypothetical protein